KQAIPARQNRPRLSGVGGTDDRQNGRRSEERAYRFVVEPRETQGGIRRPGEQEDSAEPPGHPDRAKLRRPARELRIQERQGTAARAHAPQERTRSRSRPRARHG